MVWEWIYIQLPFVQSLMDCWALKNAPHANTRTSVKENGALMLRWTVKSVTSAAAERNSGRRRVLPVLDGCSVSKWSACETASHWQDNWSINAAKGQISRWCQNNVGWLNFTDERGEALACSSVQPLIISPSCVTEVCCRCDRSSWTLTKFLSAWGANRGFRGPLRGYPWYH